MYRRVPMLVLLAVLALLAACAGQATPDTVDPSDLAAIAERFIRPLGLTTVIGQPWMDPDDLDADSVLVTYEILLLEDEAQFKQYLDADNGNLVLPGDAVEEYTKQTFGMSAEKTRECSDFDGENYVIPVGLGGAWDVEVTGAELEDGFLEIEYRIIDSQGEPAADGVVSVQLMLDGTHRYLANQQWEPCE